MRWHILCLAALCITSLAVAQDTPQPKVPEAAVPEAVVPEAAVPEAAVPEAAVPEAAVPEAAPEDVDTVSGPIDAQAADGIKTPLTAISVPSRNIKVGELVDLEVKPFERPDTLHAVSYAWTIIPSNDKVIIWPDYTRIIFGTGTKSTSYTVILTASYVFVVPEGDKVRIIQKQATDVKTITIDGEDDTPEPTPEPTPSLDGLSEDAYKWIDSVKLDTADKSRDAAALAASFRSVSAAISAGTLTDPQDIFVETRNANDLAIPNTKSHWRPWFVSLSTALSKLYADGNTDFAVIWNKLAEGLEKFAAENR